MKLQQHATDRRSEVEDAYRKLDMGLPPTEDAEMEWQRMLRDDEMKSARILQKQQVLIAYWQYYADLFLRNLRNARSQYGDETLIFSRSFPSNDLLIQRVFYRFVFCGLLLQEWDILVRAEYQSYIYTHR